MSEWGNPTSLRKEMALRRAECIGPYELTQGTETSQYLEEKKSTETPSVAASEGGSSPNRSSDRGCGAESGYKGIVSGSAWKGARQKVTVPYATTIAPR